MITGKKLDFSNLIQTVSNRVNEKLIQVIDFLIYWSPYEFGILVSLTAAPELGYTFGSWTEGSDELTTDVEYAFKAVRDRDLMAQFSAETYTVTFDAQKGLAPDQATIEVLYNSVYGALATTSRSGYTFAGWFTAPVGGDEVTSSTIVSVADDHNLYARWTMDIVYYGSIQIFIEPPEARKQAFWRLPEVSQAWLAHEEILQDIATGEYILEFKDISGSSKWKIKPVNR